MEPYEAFAEVYDIFMEDVPYDDWTRKICAMLQQYGIRDGLVLDLGCGTGQMTRRLRAAGYDMIGVDASAEMLEQARERETDNSILYLEQDMRAFELYGTVRAVISVCDCMNYLLKEEDLLKTFRLVNNYLDPGGIFIFDMNTIHKYRDEIGEMTIAENREHESFIWENYYDADSCLNQYDMTFFLEEENGLFRRLSETHLQRAYDPETVAGLLEESGMDVLAVSGEDGREPDENTQRLYFTAREKGKQK